jgi:hypothetical protein
VHCALYTGRSFVLFLSHALAPIPLFFFLVVGITLKILSTICDLALAPPPQAGRPLEAGWKGNKDSVLKSELSKKIAAQQEGRSKKSGDDDTKKKKKK